MGVNASRSLGKIALATVVIGVLIAVALTPLAGVSGAAIARTNATMASDVEDLQSGKAPQVTTVEDAAGNTMAYLYEQRRHPVEPDQISQPMKDAIVSIEDRRFYEHEGVDFQGNFRAIASNLAHGGVTQGASTLNQQYVKNYLLLVSAQDDQERAAATERSIGRKLREVRMAAEMDKNLSKDQILTNYLNLVSFGNHAFGVEAAARTYFGKPASELSVAESAMLAGMVQSSEALNPYSNPDGAKDRRNTVLNAMAANGYISQEEADAAAGEELGVLDEPDTLPNGCIGAGDRGFFCDYVMQYLDEKGIDADQLKRGGYTIKTTLDPQIQDQAQNNVAGQVNPDAPGVAGVMDVLRPDPENRDVLAMVSSRRYGLDAEKNETTLAQPYSMVGNGAGSVFKVFTAAAALETGYGIKNQVDVPSRYEAEGLGYGGADGCPANKYCVENAGSYKPTMTFEDALAHSPNTTFIKMEEQVGVDATVDMAVRLGLKEYGRKGSWDKDTSLADAAKSGPMGSFVLGPTGVNPLELSNVGATLASGGTWCEPNPIDEITDPDGNEVYVEKTPCEQAVSQGVADALSNAMTNDTDHGTAAGAAKEMGFHGDNMAAKTGTTESHQSAAFLGFNSGVAAAPYIYNDGTSTTPLCTGPARQCGEGSMYGGDEPARSFFGFASAVPAASGGSIPPYDHSYDEGRTDPALQNVIGLSENQARKQLESSGYDVTVTEVAGDGAARGTVVRALPGAGGLSKSKQVMLQVSDGAAPVPSEKDSKSDSGSSSSDSAGGDGAGDNQSGGQPGGGQPGGGQPGAPGRGNEDKPLITQDDIDSFTDSLRGVFGL